MIIAKIDYINLLPFYVFLKRYLRSSSSKKALEYHKGVPSSINKAFKQGRIEAAMISSIVSRGQKCSDLGIVAKEEVLSVLVCPGEEKEDSESNTSNVLAKILGLRGEVLIGDKALASKKKGCIDLAKKWHERYGLPFVFARFCYKRRAKVYEKLSQKFLASNVKIPYYLTKRYSSRSALSPKEIKAYLKLIHYKIGPKEKRALKKFFKLTKI